MFPLEIYRKRLTFYKALQENLEKQQRALIQNDVSQVDECAAEQLNCLEKIQEIESTWQDWLHTSRERHHNPGLSSEQILTLALEENDYQQYLNYLKEMVDVFGEIRRLKENNQFLMENSLDFIRTMLTQFSNGIDERAVYHPSRKPALKNVKINTKL